MCMYACEVRALDCHLPCHHKHTIAISPIKEETLVSIFTLSPGCRLLWTHPLSNLGIAHFMWSCPDPALNRRILQRVAPHHYVVFRIHPLPEKEKSDEDPWRHMTKDTLKRWCKGSPMGEGKKKQVKSPLIIIKVTFGVSHTYGSA